MRGAIYLSAILLLPASGAFAEELRAEESEEAGAEKESEREAEFRRALLRFSKTREKSVMLGAMNKLKEGFPESRRVLTESAKIGSKRLRAFSVNVLGERGNERDDLPVVLGALQDPSFGVRLAAVMALRKLDKDGDQSRSHLVALIERERDTGVLKMAIRTLQDWADTESLLRLLETARRVEDRGVQNFVFNALKGRTKRNFGRNVERWESYLEEQLLREEAEELLKHRSKGKQR